MCCSKLHSKLSGGFIQTVGQLDPTVQWPKQHVVDLSGRALMLRASPVHPLEFGDQLIHHLCTGGVTGRAPEH
jgi:hypothetical protein